MPLINDYEQTDPNRLFITDNWDSVGYTTINSSPDSDSQWETGPILFGESNSASYTFGVEDIFIEDGVSVPYVDDELEKYKVGNYVRVKMYGNNLYRILSVEGELGFIYIIVKDLKTGDEHYITSTDVEIVGCKNNSKIVLKE